MARARARRAAVCALVVTYKSVVAGSTYFLEHQTVPGLLARLTDPSRHALIWRFVGETLWSAPWFLAVAALVVAYALASGPARGGESRRATAAIGLVLGLQAAAYLAVYLISPRDLAWHVTSSGSRIALHVWPALLFWLMLGARDGTRAGDPGLDAGSAPATRS